MRRVRFGCPESPLGRFALLLSSATTVATGVTK